MTPTPEPVTAGALRQQIRTETQHERRWALMSDLAALVPESTPQKLAAGALQRIARELVAAHGMLARVQPARLDVVASLGVSPPENARLPVGGVLAAAVQWPASAILRAPASASQWCVGRSLSYELLLPLSFDQRVVGLLALAAEPGKPPPDVQTGQLIEVATAWLAPWLAQAGTAKPRVNDQDRRLIESLTPRERQIMALLPRGLTNAALAESLGIAPGTVKIHVERILRKLHLNDRAQAAARAVEWRLGGSQ